MPRLPIPRAHPAAPAHSAARARLAAAALSACAPFAAAQPLDLEPANDTLPGEPTTRTTFTATLEDRGCEPAALAPARGVPFCNSALDTLLALRTAAGQELARDDDQSPLGPAASGLFNIPVAPAQPLTLAVTGFGDNAFSGFIAPGLPHGQFGLFTIRVELREPGLGITDAQTLGPFEFLAGTEVFTALYTPPRAGTLSAYIDPTPCDDDPCFLPALVLRSLSAGGAELARTASPPPEAPPDTPLTLAAVPVVSPAGQPTGAPVVRLQITGAANAAFDPLAPHLQRGPFSLQAQFITAAGVPIAPPLLAADAIWTDAGVVDLALPAPAGAAAANITLLNDPTECFTPPCRADVDVFVVQGLQSARTYDIRITAADFDTTLAAFAPDGTIIARNDDDPASPGSLLSAVRVTTLVGENAVTLAVSAFPDAFAFDGSHTTAGTYTLAVTQVIPDCPADFNGDGSPGDIFDLFDFLAELDAGLDYNADTSPADIFDLFDFLADLDTPCP